MANPDGTGETELGARPAAAPMARVRGVVKRYGTRLALNGLDLEIRRGETLGLLGPNGAGKTTLMHLLSGVLTPDEGDVRIGSAGDPTRVLARRALGLAPQSIALYGSLSATENLRFFARVHGVKARDLKARVAYGLQLSDLGARAHDRAGSFSGGMQRRLNLACAVLHEPQLLLLDEPTAGVDPQSRQHLYDAILALKQTGLTVLLSTHLIDEAARLCDRVAIIDHGRVRDTGTPAELSERHGARDLQGAFLALTGSELRD